jgi:hypothetical protein
LGRTLAAYLAGSAHPAAAQTICKLGKIISFGMEKVHYLGYIVDNHGVHVDPTKIQVICDWPAPTTLTKLWSFLGLINFYHRFVLGFSHIARDLNQVTRGGVKEKIMWGLSQQ